MPNAEFDVFLSHNSADKPEVLKLDAKLREMGLKPWLDARHLIPGEPWGPAIERALGNCVSCAVIVGPNGFGNVSEDELWVAYQHAIESKQSDRRFRIIPILLPTATRGDRAKLPKFLTANTWVEFSQAIDDPVALDRLFKAIKGVPPGGEGFRLAKGDSPYRSLEAFDIQHAPLFFGREALTDWLLSRLRGTATTEGPTRFLAIVGASGSGKSSLARAGVLAKLKAGELAGSANWPRVICRPESRPLENLATALGSTDGVDLGTGLKSTLINDLAKEMLKSTDQLHLVAQGAMPPNDPDWRLVVFVDQFEELFTLNQPDSATGQGAPGQPALNPDRIAFFRNLLRAATIANGRTIVILTMRADFYGKCAAFPELATAVSQHQELVGPMSPDELRRAIETPARLSGSDIEPGLVDLLTREVVDQPGALPLLQYALSELWRKSSELGFSTMTTSAYREIGGWEGALSQRADKVLETFKDKASKDLCQQLFLRLVQPGEGTEDTKRLVRWQELKMDNPSDAASMEQMVRTLAENRLITTSGNDLNPDSTVEVVHEALIRGWPAIRSWLDNDRAGSRMHRRLTERANEWANSHSEQKTRDTSLLYRGRQLADTADWVKKSKVGLSESERSFLKASRWAEDQQRLWIWGIASLAMIVLAGIGLGWYKNNEYQNAKSLQEKVDNLVESMVATPAGGVEFYLDQLRQNEKLATPTLLKVFADAQRKDLQRIHAAYGLINHGSIDAEQLKFLLDRVPTLPKDEGTNVLNALERVHHTNPLNEELAQRVDQASTDAIRYRFVAIELGLGITDQTALLCQLKADPTSRTSLIRGFKDFGGDLARIAKTLESQQMDAELRSALCTAIGTLGMDAAEATQPTLKKLFVEAPDGGTHSAAYWALRQQGLTEESLVTLGGEAGPETDEREWSLNHLNMTMIRIPARNFGMGHATDEENPMDNEPTEPFDAFWMSDREVTVAQFYALCKDAKRPESAGESQLPMTRISWFDAVEFCNQLSKQTVPELEQAYHLDKIERTENGFVKRAFVKETGGNGFRLPTEREWEYACRAMSIKNFSFGSDEDWLGEFAVCNQPQVKTGGTKTPNGWGLFDMHGNVAEWCEDKYTDTDEFRVLRGGSFDHFYPQWLRSYFRYRFTRDSRDLNFGFRVSRTHISL